MSDTQATPTLSIDEQQLVSTSPKQQESERAAPQQVAKVKYASLFGLPQELRDIIFDLVYYQEPGVGSRNRYAEYISLPEWQRIERACHRDDPSYTPSQFQYFVDKLLISKAFFLDAAPAFVKHHARISEEGCFNDTSSLTGIVRAFTKSTTLRPDPLRRITLPHLVSLKLRLNVDDFEDYGTGCVLRRTYTPDEIRELEVFGSVVGFESAQRIEVDDHDFFRLHPKTAAEQEVWQSNLKMFEDTANEALQARTPRATEPLAGPAPLYLGSQVFLTSPNLESATVTIAGIESSSPDFSLVGTQSSATTTDAPYISGVANGGKEIFIYNPCQPWRMPPRRLQRELPEPPSLLTLPQELQDLIFDLAYYQEDPMRNARSYVGHVAWQAREEYARKAQLRKGGPLNVSPASFEHTVNTLMVSKAFFMQAAKVLVKYRCPIAGQFGALYRSIHEGIIHAYTTTVTAGMPGSTFRHLPNLTSMQLQLHVRDFEDYDTDCVYLRSLTEKEIRDLAAYQEVLQCPNLRHIQVIDKEILIHRRTQAEQAMWKSNLELFATMVSQVLSQRSPVEQRECGWLSDGCRSLYPGSRVYSPGPAKAARSMERISIIPWPLRCTTNSVTQQPCLPFDDPMASDPKNESITGREQNPLNSEKQPQEAHTLDHELDFESASTAETVTQEPLHLMCLPQELLDTIFILAYHDENSALRRSKYDDKSLKQWQRKERTRRRTEGLSYVPAMFPYVVDQFMVSKAFFVGAAKAYVQNRTGITSSVDRESVLRTDGIWYAFITKATIESWAMGKVSTLPYLTHLSVHVSGWDCEGWDGGTLTPEELAEDFREQNVYVSASKCDSIKRITLVMDDEESRRRPESEPATLDRNMAVLQEILNQMIEARPRFTEQTAGRTIDGREPLYSGSLVSLQGSSLLMPVELQLPSYEQLCDVGVPNSVTDVHRLLFRHPAALIEWMQRAKVALRYVAKGVSTEEGTALLAARGGDTTVAR
ncbi:hypothetical protein LTR10_009879 [Elasticomyces elasticus]|nr:hypothetical protein LTR10_009879 [Elasticomyces elasticus]KAK4970169.1 hypothetical protein LTR42_008336 [Elasticomyces elasticus]